MLLIINENILYATLYFITITMFVGVVVQNTIPIVLIATYRSQF